MLSRMDPLLNLQCKTCHSFFKWQGEDNNKEVCTTKSNTLISQVLGLSSLHLHMIWMIEHCGVEVKACGENTRLELCFHRSVLQADAVQIGKCCDPLESG